jgi:hypothetical protein
MQKVKNIDFITCSKPIKMHIYIELTIICLFLEPPPRDGMLNMRARPPPADDFIDIFKKIKWAFNLLVTI